MSTFRAVTVTSLGNAVAPAIGLLTAPILAQALGVVGRGELAAATAPLLLLSNAATLGLPTALTFYTSKRRPKEAQVLSLTLVFLGAAGIVSSFVVWLLREALSAGDPELADLIALAGIAIAPALVLAGLRGLALGMQRWTLVTIEKLLGSFIRLAAILVAWSGGYLDLFVATVILSATTFVGVLVYPALAFRRDRDSRPASGEAASVRAMFSYGSRVWLGSLTGILLIRLSQVLMVPLSGPYELGLFSVATTIAEAALIFNAAISTVVFSQESRDSDPTRLASLTRMSTLVTSVVAVAIAAASVWAVPTFFGSGFADALPSLFILLVAVVLGNPGSVAGQGLNARHRPGLRSLSLAIALVANLAFTVVLVPTLGSLGAAIAQVIGNVVAGALNLYWLRSRFGLRPADFVFIRRSDATSILAKLHRRKRGE